MDLEKLKYPIGHFILPIEITNEHLEHWINDIASFPNRLEEIVANLKDFDFDKKYRPEGWTIRQVIHHCADSHMNSLIRFKLTLTEDQPLIKPYFEDQWAELEDSKSLSVESSLMLLKGLHHRWSILLKSITDEQLERTFIHPEHGKTFSIKENIGVYAWHCNHHLAHITEALKRND